LSPVRAGSFSLIHPKRLATNCPGYSDGVHRLLTSRPQRGGGSGSPPPPQPRELIDIVRIVLTETVHAVALTPLSEERYREGYIALFRSLRPRGNFERDFSSPRLEIAVTKAKSALSRSVVIWLAALARGSSVLAP